LGERLLCKQEVIGSIPFTSTSITGIQTSAPPRGPAGVVVWGPVQTGPRLFFNNSEEAKRIDSIMRGVDDGL
jgi:hypothetical protein